MCSNNSQDFAGWKNLRWNLNKLKLVASLRISHRKSPQVGDQTRYKHTQAKNLRWLAFSFALKPFVCIYLFPADIKYYQDICPFLVYSNVCLIRIIIKGLDDYLIYFRDWYLFCCSFEQHDRSAIFKLTMNCICKYVYNNFRKQYILQHQSSQKYGSFKRSKPPQTIILNCLLILSLHVFILNYAVGNWCIESECMPMPYKSANI